MKKFFTRQIIIKSIEQCLKRFPVTVSFTVSLAVFLLVVCWGKDELFTERQTFTINYWQPFTLCSSTTYFVPSL